MSTIVPLLALKASAWYGVIRAVAAPALLFIVVAVTAAPAGAQERDIDDGTVTVTVQVTPRACVGDCGHGAPPVSGLPATGLGATEPLVGLALALLVLGALVFIGRRSAPPLRRRRGRP